MHSALLTFFRQGPHVILHQLQHRMNRSGTTYTDVTDLQFVKFYLHHYFPDIDRLLYLDYDTITYDPTSLYAHQQEAAQCHRAGLPV